MLNIPESIFSSAALFVHVTIIFSKVNKRKMKTACCRVFSLFSGRVEGARGGGGGGC